MTSTHVAKPGTPVYVEAGGAGPGLLVLLHGLGATGAVWRPFVEVMAGRWRGRWLAIDLPGHGASAPAESYGIDQQAAILGSTLQSCVQVGEPLTLVGHSLGGVLALALGSAGHGVIPDQVFAIGIKCAWSDADLQRMSRFAMLTPTLFDEESAAWERYLLVTGLGGLVAAGSPVLARGVIRQGEAWRLAMDPAANGSGRPPVAELFAASRCPVFLSRGGHDRLVSLQQLRAVQPSAQDIGRYGHNVTVESPEAVWDWVATALRHA